MKFTIRALHHAVICAIFLTVPLGAASEDLALGPDGALYSASLAEQELVIGRLSEDVWKEIVSIPTSSAYGSPALAEVEGRLVAAWNESSEGGSTLALAIIDMRIPPVLIRHPLPYRGGAIAIEDLAGQKAGLLMTGEKVHWLEIDIPTAKITLDVEVSSQGSARFPSILPGTPHLIAWESSGSGELSLAVAQVASGQVETVGSFNVRGFGSVAMPVLVNQRGPAIVWQGTRSGQAALYFRPISDMGFGSAKVLPSPQGLKNVINPRRAIGSDSVLSAATWNNTRWSGVRYDLSEKQPRAEIRADSQRDMLRPVVVAREGETWLWSGPDGKIEKGDILIERVFERPVVGPAAEGELRYLAFGDSITAGKLWLAESGTYEDPSDGYEVPLQELHSEILGSTTVVNAGVSGETTVEGMVRLQALLEVPDQYDRVLLLEGTNDYFVDENEDSVNDITIPNLAEMVGLIRAHGAVPIVGSLLPRDRHPIAPGADIRARKVTQALIPAMQRLGVRIARFHELFPLDDDHLADEDSRRLHPTLEGYATMAKIWMEALLTFEGDVNRDGKIDYLDAQRLSVALGTRVGNFLYNPDGDMNLDGMINVFDLSFVYGRFGTDFYPEEGAEQ